MLIRKVIISFLSLSYFFFIISSNIYALTADITEYDVLEEDVEDLLITEDEEDLVESSTTINNNYITNNEYNNYYINDTRYEYVDTYSLNNYDEDAYWRPLSTELNISLKDKIEYENKTIIVKKDGFDVNREDIDKTNLIIQPSRALEYLGYDFLLINELVNSNGKVNRQKSTSNIVSAPQFIMNIYKALGLELYDIYYSFNEDQCGIFITRTNLQEYWNMFINDHPIDYLVYSDYNVTSVNSSSIITGADALVILAEMLDFYGEPIISEYEEFLLLQVYGSEAPMNLTNKQKEAWSYLKCRGIIGDEIIDYSLNLDLENMLDLLLRASDIDSRTDFKKIQITTSLDSTFVRNGYFEQEASFVIQPEIAPISTEISFENAERYDFLIEYNKDIQFTFENTGLINNHLHISFNQNHNGSPIPGSIYEGMITIDGKTYYHFTVPRLELGNNNRTIYVNSSKANDYPLNYELKSNKGGIYSIPNNYDSKSTIYYDSAKKFSSIMPTTYFADEDRIINTTNDFVRAATTNTVTETQTFVSPLIDIEKTRENVKKAKGTLTTSGDNKTITITVPIQRANYDSYFERYSPKNFINTLIVIKSEYSYTVQDTNTIMNLFGDSVYISLDDITIDAGKTSMPLLKKYEYLMDDNVLILYTIDGDITIIDEKNRIIQKGQHYMQFPSILNDKSTPLFDINKKMIDFRAIYGSVGASFRIREGGTRGVEISIYDNNFNKNTGNLKETVDYQHTVHVAYENGYKVYNWININQRLATDKFAVNINADKSYTNNLEHGKIDVLVEFKENSFVLNGETKARPQEFINDVYIPLSSTNMYGNYLLYTDIQPSNGIQRDYLIIVSQKVAFTSYKKDVDYKELFPFLPSYLNEDSVYDITVIDIQGKLGEAYNIINIPGVGYCYKVPRVAVNTNSRKTFFKNYRSGANKKASLPYQWSDNSQDMFLINYNMNYFEQEMYDNLTPPKKTDTYNNVVLAPVAVMSWFTDPRYIATTNLSSILRDSTYVTILWGTMSLTVNTRNETVKESVYGLDLTQAFNANKNLIKANGILKLANKATDYKYPKMFSMSAQPLEVSINPAKIDINAQEVIIRTADLQDFFTQFDEITLTNFVKTLDNGMSIVYYLITRVIPLIIIGVLSFLLTIALIADNRLVQIFCNRYFDVVKILTVGHHSIQTLKQRRLLISMVIALIIIGMIQMGVLERLIMAVVRFFYAAELFFK